MKSRSEQFTFVTMRSQSQPFTRQKLVAMITRRNFLWTLPATGAGPLAWAAPPPDASRKALVIGNGNYREAPLVNPVNDARSMGTMLRNNGFSVSEHLNVRRLSMAAAVEEFLQDVGDSKTQLILLYYAGHGIQMDWRNYLLPVDAIADSAVTIRNSSIDLNGLMGQFGKLKGKTFVVILDACRNDPFGATYQPDQKGLSQFDAPVGSLLAYATSPGNVASDGSGQNGLYTENLLRELATPGVRLEDALKRVRLNVRLASQGAQIPWETTSLEGDVVINQAGAVKLSDAEQERLLEEDFAAWARVKQSQSVDDWVLYLRKFPNGRFAELAQSRLNRLQQQRVTVANSSTSVAMPPSVPLSTPAMAHLPNPDAANGDAAASVVAAPAATPTVLPAGGMQIVEIGAGKPVPPLFQRSANPYSAGLYALGRRFSLGDTYTLRASDLLTGVVRGDRTVTVTKVDELADRVEFNQGETVMDTMGNYLKDIFGNEAEQPMQMFPAELQVGKAWQTAWEQNSKLVSGARVQQRVQLSLRIASFERVEVPAGVFDAFRIDVEGFQFGGGGSARREQKIWVVPGLSAVVKMQGIARGTGGIRGNGIIRADQMELVSARFKAMESRCTATIGSGATRNLVVRQGCA